MTAGIQLSGWIGSPNRDPEQQYTADASPLPKQPGGGGVVTDKSAETDTSTSLTAAGMLLAWGLAIRIPPARSQAPFPYEPVLPLSQADKEHLGKAVKRALWRDFVAHSPRKVTRGSIRIVAADLAFAWQSQVVYATNSGFDFMLRAGAATRTPPTIQMFWFCKRGGKWVEVKDYK